MFRSSQNRGDASNSPAVDIAPLIDIVFILLIFFLVTTTFIRDTGVEVIRPQANVTKTLEPTSMRVSITASGSVYTDGSQVSLEELQTRVRSFISREQQRTVIVIPDTEVPSGRLVEVMDAARMAGAEDVAVATKAEGG